MPSTPKPAAADEPEFIDMEIPPRTRGSFAASNEMLAIAGMPVNARRMLFFALPRGLDAKKHAQRLRGAVQRVVVGSGKAKKFETRLTKSGVIEGFGVWRIE